MMDENMTLINIFKDLKKTSAECCLRFCFMFLESKLCHKVKIKLKNENIAINVCRDDVSMYLAY